MEPDFLDSLFGVSFAIAGVIANKSVKDAPPVGGFEHQI